MTKILKEVTKTAEKIAKVHPKIIYQKDPSKILGIFAVLFGFLSIFMFSVLFVPLSVLFSVLAFLKKDISNKILGGIGFILSFIGIMTSPLLLSLIGFTLIK